jgi:hypothetical protein
MFFQKKSHTFCLAPALDCDPPSYAMYYYIQFVYWNGGLTNILSGVTWNCNPLISASQGVGITAMDDPAWLKSFILFKSSVGHLPDLALFFYSNN